MRDTFVLFAPGLKDSNNRAVVRLTPDCYSRVQALKAKTGLSMCRILEQCVDFALDHMEDEDDVK